MTISYQNLNFIVLEVFMDVLCKLPSSEVSIRKLHPFSRECDIWIVKVESWDGASVLKSEKAFDAKTFEKVNSKSDFLRAFSDSLIEPIEKQSRFCKMQRLKKLKMLEESNEVKDD